MWCRHRSSRGSFVNLLVGAAFAAGALSAQSGYAPRDIQSGKQLYRVNCNNCHGPSGETVPEVDLGHGSFRHASTDDELATIMLQGILGTSMPPANLSDQQAHQIVAYLRSLAAVTDTTFVKADLAHGRSLFESKGCLDCHRMKGRGSRVGPDLSNIGARRNPADIERSIVDPNAEILPENQFVQIVTRDGVAITGRILNEDSFSVELIDNMEKLVSLEKADLSKLEFRKDSPMPAYREKLSGNELLDLTGYLVSLKGL